MLTHKLTRGQRAGLKPVRQEWAVIDANGKQVERDWPTRQAATNALARYQTTAWIGYYKSPLSVVRLGFYFEVQK